MRTALILAAAALLAAPAAAQAHVTLQPNEAPAGGFKRLDVRVPNERDNASTTKVDLQMPPGFANASYEPVPGWSVKVTTSKLATPIKTDDGEITEAVSRITWTADSAGDAIPPGAFRDFGLSVRIPGKAGDALTFKALQTYSNGEIVRWIGPEGSDNPAPVVKVTSGDEAPAAAPATPAATATPATSGGSDALSITALIIGAIGLLTAIAALATTRRRART
jgi:uncharacterized protein